MLVHEGDLSIRRMRQSDLERIVAWRFEPHVREFWDNDEDAPELTVAQVESYYAALVDPSHATVATIIEIAATPIGYLQFYKWSAYAEPAREMGIPLDGEAYGLDLFIGDRTRIGSGVGTRVLDLVCRYLFDACGASRVALLTSIENVRARRAYERAGFTCVRETLDMDTRGGARIASWLMVRER
jgi:RimJ/RimL family protein N-acetyltransferase